MGEAVGGVDEVAELAFQCERFGCERAGRFEGADVFVTEAFALAAERRQVIARPVRAGVRRDMK